MKRLLFLRNYKVRRGGHITVRDYFRHSMDHPEIDPYVYFTPQSDTEGDIWADLPDDRRVADLAVQDWDVIFVGNRLWRILPPDLGRTQVINVLLHVRHATSGSFRQFLSRPAYRIANVREVREAVLPFANGPVEVIHEAIDPELFSATTKKKPGSVLMYGQKNPKLADALAAALAADGVDVTSFNVGIPHVEFAKLMAESEIYVGLPNRTEGGYRPPLEAMASGCAVVCSDAVGTREYLIKDVTCLQPAYDDFDGHLTAIRRLLNNEGLRRALQQRGGEMAARYSMERQRELYHDFLNRYIVGERRAAIWRCATTVDVGAARTRGA